jgi:hypothetical protein
LNGEGWLSAKEDWTLSDTEILKAAACVHPKYFLGSRSGKASQYAVLDIDTDSKYHTAEGYATISALLEKAGIEGYNLYRSSDSGGWHIYIFFDSPVSSRDLYRQFCALFALHELEIAKGTLEIFPNPGDGRNSVGQGLRLPLQPGFAWLSHHNQSVLEERDEISPTEALLTFVNDIECSVNPYSHFHKLRAFVEQVASSRSADATSDSIDTRLAEVVSIRKNIEGAGSIDALRIVRASFRKIPPGIKADTWVKGREYFSTGLTGPSQRADAVFSLSHYLFYGDPERKVIAMGYGFEEERKWLIDDIMQRKHNGQSKEIASGRSDAFQYIARATAWLPPHRRSAEASKYVPSVPISWVRNNANRAVLAQKKIAAAVEDFLEAQIPFSTRDLSIKSGVSSRTLAKYPDLWKPAMESLRNACLKTALHEYIAVEYSEVVLGHPQDVSFEVGSVVQKLDSSVLTESQVSVDFIDRFTSSQWFEKVPSDNWRDRIALVCRKIDSGGSRRGLVFLINVLARELLLAPSRADWLWLSAYLLSLKEKALSQGQLVQLSIGMAFVS